MVKKAINCCSRYRIRVITFSGLTDEELLSRNAAKLASKFCEKGLRYDLTVPFARYVVMHRDKNSVPFQALPDSAGVARRPSTEGALS